MHFPQDEYTPFGYLDISGHSRNLTPRGVLRSHDAGLRWHFRRMPAHTVDDARPAARADPGTRQNAAGSPGTSAGRALLHARGRPLTIAIEPLDATQVRLTVNGRAIEASSGKAISFDWDALAGS